MKTKLLRKVRKEFKIEYWPNGLPTEDVKAKYTPQMTLTYGRHGWEIRLKYPADDDYINDAKETIIEVLRRRYPHLGSYRKKFTKQQIWP